MITILACGGRLHPFFMWNFILFRVRKITSFRRNFPWINLWSVERLLVVDMNVEKKTLLSLHYAWFLNQNPPVFDNPRKFFQGANLVFVLFPAPLVAELLNLLKVFITRKRDVPSNKKYNFKVLFYSFELVMTPFHCKARLINLSKKKKIFPNVNELF